MTWIPQRKVFAATEYNCYIVTFIPKRKLLWQTDIVNFLDISLNDPRDEPVPLASFHLGPKLSSWMKWDSASDGRVYHFGRSNTSIWLAVDDGADAIYLYIFRHSPDWLYKFRTYIPFMK
jgi:hypothetical protein